MCGRNLSQLLNNSSRSEYHSSRDCPNLSYLIKVDIYINKHAEELRSKFVSHKEKEELEIVYSHGETLKDVDLGAFTFQMGQLLGKRIKDRLLRAWFMPSFTTPRKSDQATASISRLLLFLVSPASSLFAMLTQDD